MYALEVDPAIDSSIAHPVMRMECPGGAPLIGNDHWMIGIIFVMMMTRSYDCTAVVKKDGSVIHLIFVLCN